jgi:hypothetical protein
MSAHVRWRVPPQPTRRCAFRSATVRSVAGTLHWLWAFATADTTVYAIRPGRGFMDAATILGEDFAGVLARDGWAHTAASCTLTINRVLRICCAVVDCFRSIIPAARSLPASSGVSSRRLRCVIATPSARYPRMASRWRAAGYSNRCSICSPPRDPPFPPSSGSPPT